MKMLEDTEVEAKAPGSAKPASSAGERRARRDYTCEHCGRNFSAKPVHDRRGISPRRFCSKRCAGAHRSAEARATRPVGPWPGRETGVPERPVELMALSAAQPLTPAQSAKVRSYILGLLRVQIPLAHRVVLGEVGWSPTQARVFVALLNKCLPDLSASFVESQRPDDDLCMMSRRDLEALAAGMDPDVRR